MTRVLMVGPVPPPHGGIASLMQDLMRSTLTREYSFDLFPTSERYPGPGGLRHLPGRTRFRLARFTAFYRTLVRGRYRLAHIHTAEGAFRGAATYVLLARAAGVKALLHIQGTEWDSFYSPMSALKKALTRKGFNLAHRVVVLHGQWAEKLKEVGVRSEVRVIPNLIDRPQIPPESARHQIRQKLGLDDRHFVVLTVGMVGRRKGMLEILKAVPRVAAREENVRFVFAGGEENPGASAEVLEAIRDNRLGRWVLTLGDVERSRVPLLLAAADVFLLPSFFEGMPLAILEAMACGLPVIATRVGGVGDVIEDGQSGLLIRPGRPEEIASAVLRLRDDAALRERLGAAGARVFEAKFESSKVIEQFRSAYRFTR